MYIWWFYWFYSYLEKLYHLLQYCEGLEASASSSDIDGHPDLRRALSLLSTTSWGLNEPERSSMDQLVHVNSTSRVQPVTHADLPNWPFAPSQLDRVEQPPPEPQVHSLNFPSSSSNSNLQELQVPIPKAPNQSDCLFYTSQINWLLIEKLGVEMRGGKL